MSESEEAMGYYKGNDVSIPLHAEARSKFIELGEWVECNVPNSRLRALALTNLQQSLLWLNNSIAASKGDR